MIQRMGLVINKRISGKYTEHCLGRSLGSVTFPRLFPFGGLTIYKQITKLTEIIITQKMVGIFKGREMQEFKIFVK
jgi:hypothetical protein